MNLINQPQVRITTNTPSGKATYALQRESENKFNALIDWDKSDVRNGGFGFEFTDNDTLEIRDWGGDKNWDVRLAPQDDSTLWIEAPSEPGIFSPEESSLEEVSFGSPIKPENYRQAALQVASSLVGIPFLDRMLEQNPQAT